WRRRGNGRRRCGRRLRRGGGVRARSYVLVRRGRGRRGGRGQEGVGPLRGGVGAGVVGARTARTGMVGARVVGEHLLERLAAVGDLVEVGGAHGAPPQVEEEGAEQHPLERIADVLPVQATGEFGFGRGQRLQRPAGRLERAVAGGQ